VRDDDALIKFGQMSFDSLPLAYLRAASHRIETAIVLIEMNDPGRNLDGVYLAGYTVECGFKALILERTARRKRAPTFESLSSGAKGHRLNHLAKFLTLRNCILPIECRASLKSVSSLWSTDLRYEASLIPSRTAKTFLQNVRTIHEWVKKSF
jgi:hypothetical protein